VNILKMTLHFDNPTHIRYAIFCRGAEMQK
jgi:hypothetical protein